MFGYIYACIKNQFLKIRKQNNIRKSNEVEDDDVNEAILSKIEAKSVEHNGESNMVEIRDLMKKVLTPMEYWCVDMLILNGLKAKRLAELKGVSEQSISNAKKRALKKLRKHFENLL